MTSRADNADKLFLADVFLRLERCPGGRLLVRGYVCPHCDADPTDDQPCGAPRRSRRIRATAQ